MPPHPPFLCRLDDPAADAAFRAFTAAICGGGSRRYAILSHHSGLGPRCLLDGCGRCLAADTPWQMARAMIEPLLRFDDTVAWVALFPADDWKQRCDLALGASFDGGEPWARRLAQELAEELPTLPRLIVSR